MLFPNILTNPIISKIQIVVTSHFRTLFTTAFFLKLASCLTKCLMEVSFSITGVTLKGKDTLTALTYQNKLTIFSRSVTKASRLYWAQEVNGNWSGWALIGGSSVSLKSDVAVAYNGFSKVRIKDLEIWVK